MTIYLSRHGQSIYNTEDRIGGNSNLSPTGQIYALKLASYMNNLSNIEIWTSSLLRTINTAVLLNFPKIIYNNLDEINAGDFENVTFGEFKKNNFEEYTKRQLNKLKYKYSNGESYLDLIERVNPFVKKAINKAEKGPLLIIAHQAVLRVIYGKLMNYGDEEIPHLSIPLHTIFKIELNDEGGVIREEKIEFEI